MEGIHEPPAPRSARELELLAITARQRRYRTAIRLAHHATWFLASRFPETFPLRMVMGYPKSGTTWIAQQIADYLQLPMPTHYVLPLGFAAVAQGHYAPSRHRARGVYVLRDGRDVMLSLYHYLAWDVPDGVDPPLRGRQRTWFKGLRDKSDVRANLPRFIERQMQVPVASLRLNWGRHFESYLEHAGPGLALLRYEDALRDPVGALADALPAFTARPIDSNRLATTVSRFSFESQSGRRPGEERRESFLRAGLSRQWTDYFTREAAEVFDHYCGDALVAAGYESDRSWVERCDAPRAAA